jgi:hypothetical protein
MKTLSKDKILAGMMKHAIGVSEAELIGTPGRINLNLKECKWCLGMFAEGHGSHQSSCALNPHRSFGKIEVCQWCDVGMSQRGLWKHEQTCDGIPEHTIEKLAAADLIKIRKAKTLRDAILEMNYPKMDEFNFKNSPGNDEDLDAIVEMMNHQVENSMKVTIKEYEEWVELTNKLWNKA